VLSTLNFELRALLQDLPQKSAAREELQLPRAIYDEETGDWKIFSQEWEMAQARLRIPLVIEVEEPLPVSRTAQAFNAILTGYANDNVKQVNQAIAGYQALVTDVAGKQVNESRISFESYFNHAQPFTIAMILYVFAFILSAVGMLAWNREFNRAAFGLIIVALLLHTLSLASRVYISGRPPVTNLYSSAIFIGWASVVLCLILEAIYKIGVCNLLGTIAGASTLVVAMYLGADGDTFTVLVAVLDTQFWLTTHVICVTIGYATTFVAGLFGIAYLIGRLTSASFAFGVGKDIIRMCYGVVCFAIFFSFLGTVLGGLWADDSWGRFWGWDPKENGALIIVLWNAIILHARWGGMVKDRGLATLAVAGNIVTSWSWFGVNQLGIGLHSYGFTKGVVVALTLFVISQMIVMMLAIVPTQPVDAKLVKR
jgi:ABC-type transport system involved in cytochrome c biogenesis permease subunit